jgi:hypothetical protein
MNASSNGHATALGMIFVLALTGCNGSLFESKDEGLADLGKIEQRWDDGTAVAGHTGRNALSGPVQNLQSIKRDLSTVKVSKCLTEAKGILIEIMDSTVNEYLEFMGGANHTLTDKSAKIDAYSQSKDKCSGKGKGEAPGVKPATADSKPAEIAAPATAPSAAPSAVPSAVPSAEPAAAPAPRGDYAQQLAATLTQNMLHGPACDSFRQVISQIANNGMPENVRVAQLKSLERPALKAHCLVE